MQTSVATLAPQDWKTLPHKQEPAEIESVWRNGQLRYRKICSECGQIQHPPVIHLDKAITWECSHCSISDSLSPACD